MELERTHTQPRDPNIRENVINTGDNLKHEELYCRIGNFPARIIVKPEKNINWNSEEMLCCHYRQKKDARDYK